MALIAAGYDVRPWYDHFPGQDDVQWLPAVGARRWIVLTKDQNVRRNPLEIEAILNSGVKAFVLTVSDFRKEQLAELLLRVLPKIERLCTQRGAFIFNITRMGYFSRISTRTLRRRAPRK